jgi:alpha-beta hydrolase superfamily lysophospholipase
MNEKTFTFTDRQGQNIFVYKWLPDRKKQSKSVIQIAHGMQEHAERYRDFARFLTKNNITVYANDHRGHGKTAGSLENLGNFAENNGWYTAVENLYELSTIIKEENPGLPVFLLGHSMGSFLARTYIYTYPGELNGVILSATGGNPGLMGKIGLSLAKREVKTRGGKTRSLFLHNLTCGDFNKAFKPSRTDYDWLTRDYKTVDKYIKDPLCGGIASARFYYDLVFGVNEINKKSNIKKIPKNLPVYMFSGNMDPVGNFGKGVIELYKTYKKAGISDVEYKLYRKGRHEMLNEINREEVYYDLLDWVRKHV